jgi:hypothetical protein
MNGGTFINRGGDPETFTFARIDAARLAMEPLARTLEKLDRALFDEIAKRATATGLTWMEVAALVVLAMPPADRAFAWQTVQSIERRFAHPLPPTTP